MTCPICITVWCDSLPNPNNIYDAHYQLKCRCCGWTTSPDTKPITIVTPIPIEVEEDDE